MSRYADFAKDAQRTIHGGWAVYKPSYRSQCTPDAEWQRCKLESLRYRFGGYEHGTRIVQVLGDWCRRWFGA